MTLIFCLERVEIDPRPAFGRVIFLLFLFEHLTRIRLLFEDFNAECQHCKELFHQHSLFPNHPTTIASICWKIFFPKSRISKLYLISVRIYRHLRADFKRFVTNSHRFCGNAKNCFMCLRSGVAINFPLPRVMVGKRFRCSTYGFFRRDENRRERARFRSQFSIFMICFLEIKRLPSQWHRCDRKQRRKELVFWALNCVRHHFRSAV